MEQPVAIVRSVKSVGSVEADISFFIGFLVLVLGILLGFGVWDLEF
jgi:hypothetical protein